MPKQYGIFGRKVSDEKVQRVVTLHGGKFSFFRYIPHAELKFAIETKTGFYYRRWNSGGQIVWMYLPKEFPSNVSQRVKDGALARFLANPLSPALANAFSDGKKGLGITSFDKLNFSLNYNPL